METLLVVPVFTIAVALFAVLILLHFVPMGLWISALAADVSISLFNLQGAISLCIRHAIAPRVKFLHEI